MMAPIGRKRGTMRARDVSIPLAKGAPAKGALAKGAARSSTPAAPRVDDQLEFFPINAAITALDPRAVLGASTRVTGIWRVEFAGERRPHLVYHDRHGWYCEEHGPTCRAVGRVRET